MVSQTAFPTGSIDMVLDNGAALAARVAKGSGVATILAMVADGLSLACANTAFAGSEGC